MPEHQNSWPAVILRAYLLRNILEFKGCRNQIFSKLQLVPDAPWDDCLLSMIDPVLPSYLRYLNKEISYKEFTILMRIAIQVRFSMLLINYRPDDILLFTNKAPDRKKQKVKSNAGYLYRYLKPIFMPFNGIEELRTLLAGAENLSIEMNTNVCMIFMGDYCYNKLLRCLYQDSQRLKEMFRNLLTNFSMIKIIENLGYGTDITGMEQEKQLLIECRKKLQLSPQLQEQAKQIAIAVEEVIDNRLKQILMTR